MGRHPARDLDRLSPVRLRFVTGRAIVLVGVSSVGKTSVAGLLQLALPEPYLHVGLDHFLSMFPYEWHDHPRGPGPGFWVDQSRDEGGSPRARIRYGDAGDRLLTGMRAAVNALLATGNNVILDEMPVDDAIMPAWRRVARSLCLLGAADGVAPHPRRPRTRADEGPAAGQLTRSLRRAPRQHLGPRHRHRRPHPAGDSRADPEGSGRLLVMRTSHWPASQVRPSACGVLQRTGRKRRATNRQELTLRHPC